jgi:multidrug transporter EmrE-like cation transporter
VTQAFPVFLGTSYAAVTVVGAVVVLGESLTAVRIGGIVLIGAGLVLIGR